MFQPAKLLTYITATSALGIISGCSAAALSGPGIDMVKARAPSPMSSSSILPLLTARDSILEVSLGDIPDQCKGSDSCGNQSIYSCNGTDCCANDIVNAAANCFDCAVSAGKIDKGEAQDDMNGE
ncbi:hypothetical protein K435DRAFT_858370 [Dendrothele bispora CBS 962.96]|uniref:Uncharacterized protein n=1 Tax=Dendrothele bispora (strain CBS 962.96) TaxID=1314807 RepID=A0A4S8M4C8_DENBC|nr:hypothetical protein K435DRAFT_858370 [Dendrothele bispora CBS 962.96]